MLKKMGNKLKWGLIGGSKIKGYSIAPGMWDVLFKEKGMSIEYFIIDGDISSKISVKIKKYLEDPLFVGANIALPWKYLGYEYCDYVEEIANKMDAVNTIIKRGKNIEGYNTDGVGIVNSLKKVTSLKNKTVLILGSGSSSQTIPEYLIKNKVKKIYFSDIIFSRSKRLSRKYSHNCRIRKIEILPIKIELIKGILGDIDILINATPCGMKGFDQKYPLDKKLFVFIKKNCVIAEAVYNPYETPMITYFKKKGNKTCPGIKMLIEQAAISFQLAFGKKISEKDKYIMEEYALKALKNGKK
jgi:shikimate dehydrogenase